MSMSPLDVKKYHEYYEQLPHAVRLTVDYAYRAAVMEFRHEHMATHGNDVAESLVAALTYYIMESNPDLYTRLLGRQQDKANTVHTATSPEHDAIDAGDVYP
jgi:hypothetical protein